MYFHLTYIGNLYENLYLFRVTNIYLIAEILYEMDNSVFNHATEMR